MSFESEQARQGLFSVLDALDRASIPHILTGALVRNLLASARTSEDFDIVVDMRGRTPETVREALESAGFTVEGPSRNEFGERLVVEAGGVETDLWLAPDSEVHRREMEQARIVDYRGRRLRILNPEDFVLRKLVTFGRIRRRSTDLDDAYQVLMIHWEDVDVERLVARAQAQRVGKLAEELVQVVREDRASTS